MILVADCSALIALASSDVYLSNDLLAVVMEIAGKKWPVSG